MSYTPLPPDERPLIEQVDTIWKRGLHQLPVYKDFPRLAGGFEIANGATKKMIFKEKNSSSRAIACRDIITKLAILFPDDETPKGKTPKRKRRRTITKSRDAEYEEKEVGDVDDSDREFEPTPIPDVDYAAEDEQELDCLDDDDDEPTTPVKRTISREGSSVSYSFAEKQPGESFSDLILLHYAKNVRDVGGDLSVQIDKFLKSGAIHEDGKLARLLKCVHQEIICPAVMELRTSVYPNFAYKDIKGTWYVRVELFFEQQRKRSRSAGKSSVISGSISGSDLKSGQIIPSSPKARRRRKKSLSGSKASMLGKTSGDETSTISSKQKKERKRSIPDFLSRTNSLPAFDNLPRRQKTDRTKTSPGRGPSAINDEMSTLRSSVHQTMGIAVESDEDESHSPLTPRKNNNIILELAKNPIHKVRVLHRKRERSNTPNVIPDANSPESYCEFEWELAMTFDGTLDNLLEVSLRIIDVTTPEDISIEQRSDLLAAVSPFTTPEFPYIIVWKSPVDRGTLFKDLNTLSTICEAMDGEGNKLYESNNSKLGLSSLLLCLILQLGGSGRLSEEILSIVAEKSSHNAAKTIKNFIHGLKDDDPSHKPILNILKATSAELQTPTISHFRNLLVAQAKEIKSVKGSRRVVIVFSENEIRVSQYQRLTCQLLDSTSDNFFVFSFVDHFSFSPAMDHLDSVNTEIIEHSFSPQILETRKQRIKQVLKPYLTQNSIESKTSTISIEDAIQCLANALSQLSPSDQIVNDPDLPGGKMSSLNLLDLLRQTLPDDFPPLTFTELTQGSSEEN